MKMLQVDNEKGAAALKATVEHALRQARELAETPPPPGARPLGAAEKEAAAISLVVQLLISVGAEPAGAKPSDRLAGLGLGLVAMCHAGGTDMVEGALSVVDNAVARATAALIDTAPTPEHTLELAARRLLRLAMTYVGARDPSGGESRTNQNAVEVATQTVMEELTCPHCAIRGVAGAIGTIALEMPAEVFDIPADEEPGNDAKLRLEAAGMIVTTKWHEQEAEHGGRPLAETEPGPGTVH